MCKSVVKHVKEDPFYELEDYDVWDYNGEKLEIYENGKHNPNDYSVLGDFLMEFAGEVGYDSNYNEETEVETKEYDCVINRELSEFFFSELEGILSTFKSKFFTTITENTKYTENNITLSKEEFVQNKNILNSILKKLKEELENYLYSLDVNEYYDIDFYDIYSLGCNELGIEIDIFYKNIDSYEIDNQMISDIVYGISTYINSDIDSIGKNKNIKNPNLELEKLSNDIGEILTAEIKDNEPSIKNFKKRANGILNIFRTLKIYFINNPVDENYVDKFNCVELSINKLIYKLAKVEAFEFTKYEEDNPNEIIDLKDVFRFKECRHSLFQEGIKDCLKKVYLKEQVKIEIEQLLPHDPKNEYLTARQLNRHFIIHVGNTNTGKTHSSLEALKNARKGLYLAPLRLLALEVQEKLNSEKVPCNLITGEEENLVIGAEHISSTVEKVNLTNFFDVCVIDECQMIGDSSRGFAWTKAILGVLAKEIHICTAPEALDLLMKIIKSCNDTFEIVEHHRDTELKSERGRFNISKEVQKGDALVVFSKKNVLAVASDLINRGIKASIIYGSLPYNTRKKQFQRFLKGETDVVVCTDAIGMGVNLPIKRVIFLEMQKFDGKERRSLNVSEVKQIAGRAGRRGIYDIGYAKNINGSIENILQQESEKVSHAYVGVSEILLNINRELLDIFKTWKSIKLPKLYKKADVSRNINLIQILTQFKEVLTKEDMFRLSFLPFDEKNAAVYDLWIEYVKAYCDKEETLNKPVFRKEELNELETYYKCLDLYYSFSKNFGFNMDATWLMLEKENIANKINNILLKEIRSFEKKCRQCGKQLSWDYPYNICNNCYQDSRNYYYSDGYYF
jgi:RNAse (barnase) inhibitor barstar